MNQSTFRFLLGEIQSAIDRTYLTGSYRGVCWTLRGRCSPYVSHRSVEFQPVLFDRALWICGRDREEGFAVYLDGIQPTPEEVEGWANDLFAATAALVPAEIVRNLFATLCRELGFLLPPSSESPLLWVVVVRRRLIGWAEDGKPILAGMEGAIDPLVRGYDAAHRSYGDAQRAEEMARLEAAFREQPDLLVTTEDAERCGMCRAGVVEWIMEHVPHRGDDARLADLASHFGDHRVRAVCLTAIARAAMPVAAVVE